MTPMIEYEETNTSSNLICGILCVQPCPNITWKIDDIPISGHTEMEENGTLSHYVNKINIESPDSFHECSIENSLLEQTWTGLWIQKGGLDKVALYLFYVRGWGKGGLVCRKRGKRKNENISVTG